MAYVYARGNIWWFRVKDPATKRWLSERTPHRVDDPNGKRKAKRAAEKTQARVNVVRATDGTAAPGPLTVREYTLGEWIAERAKSGHDWKADQGKLTKHVLPVIGDMPLADVRTVHVAKLVSRLRHESEPKLAPRSVRNIYTVVAALFRDAAVAGLVEQTPCILTTAQLGKIRDADPEWRAGALFTREEAEALISDPRIPLDRQLVYGFGLLAGLRPGEASALRWRHYDASGSPLGRLTIAKSYNAKRHLLKSTKTETVKTIPVHPTLAAMLAEWRLSGWEKMMGRAPTDEDLIVPLPPATIERRTKRLGEPFRGYNYSSRRWREVDLPMLGWRERSLYDTRSTFVTLAIDDGADRDVIEHRVTHAKPKRSAFDGYDRGPHWEATCREVAKLNVRRSVRRLGVIAGGRS